MTLTVDSLIAMGAACIWTLICLYIGFRFGRLTADRPMAPFSGILKGREQNVNIEEDPYDIPMYGKPKPAIPTMPDS